MDRITIGRSNKIITDNSPAYPVDVDNILAVEGWRDNSYSSCETIRHELDAADDLIIAASVPVYDISCAINITTPRDNSTKASIRTSLITRGFPYERNVSMEI